MMQVTLLNILKYYFKAIVFIENLNKVYDFSWFKFNINYFKTNHFYQNKIQPIYLIQFKRCIINTP